MEAECEKLVAHLWRFRREPFRPMFKNVQAFQDFRELRRINLGFRQADRHRIRVAPEALATVQEAFKYRCSASRKRVREPSHSLRPRENVPPNERFREHCEVRADRMKPMTLHFFGGLESLRCTSQPILRPWQFHVTLNFQLAFSDQLQDPWPNALRPDRDKKVSECVPDALHVVLQHLVVGGAVFRIFGSSPNGMNIAS